MNDFPEFMKNPINKVVPASQFTKDIEGYVFDGADGSQMIFWTNEAGGKSIEHTHAYDEYVVVVQGQNPLLCRHDDQYAGQRPDLRRGLGFCQ